MKLEHLKPTLNFFLTIAVGIYIGIPYTNAAGLNLQVPIFSYTQASDFAEYVSKIFEYMLYILVPIAILVIMFAGVKWITAAGDMSKIKEAKGYIVNAFLGLTIAILSYLILSLFGLNRIGLPEVSSIVPEALETEEIDVGTSPSQPPTLGTGKKKAIYVHWSAGTTSSVSEHYTFTVKGDGTVVQSFPEEQDPSYCTFGRNKQSICIAAAGASGFDPKCYPKGSILGEGCTSGPGKFTEKQIAALRAKTNALKSKWSIPAITHSQAAAMDNYHCVPSMNRGSNSRGKCKWDFWKDANNYAF